MRPATLVANTKAAFQFRRALEKLPFMQIFVVDAAPPFFFLDTDLMEWTPPPEAASMCQSGSVAATT
jgi:hypothetical protein